MTTERGRGGCTQSSKFYTGLLFPEVQTLIPLYTIFDRKRYHFHLATQWKRFLVKPPRIVHQREYSPPPCY